MSLVFLIKSEKNLYCFDLNKVIETGRKNKAGVTALRKTEKELTKKYSSVLLDKNNKIISFEEKPQEPKSDLASIFCYYLTKEEIDNSDTKLPKGSVFEAIIDNKYTNLVQDPTDLTTANWTEINGCVASASSLTINGNAFTKLTTDGTANPQIRQIITVTSGVSNVASVILRNGNLSGAETSTFFYIDNVGLSTTLGQLTITWATKAVVQNDGDDFDYTWIDDDTVELYLEVTTDQVSTRYRIDPDNGTVAGKYIYATECQVVDSTTTMFPFVDGVHAIDIINETFTLPDQCTIVWRGKPRFAFDT
ncbi:hypothetical protein LCGC14_3014620, partial [marine sediment metagenome]